MEIILVDTSFLFAYYNSEDKHHDSARNYFDNVVKPQTHPLGFLLTDYIFDELITLILIRTKNKTQAIFTGNSILNSQTLKLIYLKEETISKAWTKFCGYLDKQWSFTDCTSMVFMEENGIEKVACFDEHFEQMGFIRLPSDS